MYAVIFYLTVTREITKQNQKKKNWRIYVFRYSPVLYFFLYYHTIYLIYIVYNTDWFLTIIIFITVIWMGLCVRSVFPFFSLGSGATPIRLYELWIVWYGMPAAGSIYAHPQIHQRQPFLPSYKIHVVYCKRTYVWDENLCVTDPLGWINTQPYRHTSIIM